MTPISSIAIVLISRFENPQESPVRILIKPEIKDLPVEAVV